MKIILTIAFCIVSFLVLHGQNRLEINSKVGIGTNSPKGQLDITSSNLGIVIPRTGDIKQVTDGYGNPPVDGTIAYDTLRKAMMFRVQGKWISISNGSYGQPIITALAPFNGNYTYIKASNTPVTQTQEYFGVSVNISADGNTLAVGASGEDSNATGINGNQNDNSLANSGAVYVFVRSGGTWVQQAYIKASNTGTEDEFGNYVNLSADGNTLAVSAHFEDSDGLGINGHQFNNNALDAGAVYIFTRAGTVWSQQAYVKASNTQANDRFGRSLSLNAHGNTLTVGATNEDSNATGINGDQTNNLTSNSGAVYVFIRSGSMWSQQAYIKASNTSLQDFFGSAMSLTADGNSLTVGVAAEDSNATGIDGNQSDNSASAAGAAYVFKRNGTVWSQQAYIKASNTNAGDQFGASVCMSPDGNTLAVGAPLEDSNATGVGGNQNDNSSSNSGAVYVFIKFGNVWSQQAYIKASNTGDADFFGNFVSLSADGITLAASAIWEDSNATGIDGNQSDNTAMDAGAVYLFKKVGNFWSQEHYIKASNTGASDIFGNALSLSANGNTLIVAAYLEDSNATGINGNQTDNTSIDAGAVYVVE